MHLILVLILVLICIYTVTSWILPKVIAVIFEHKFKVIIKIGRIGVPYLKIYDVSITKSGFTIQVDEISIKSSFFNSELTKLVTLVVKDVRVNKDIGKSESDWGRVSNQKIYMDFREKKIPHFITTFAQFMAVHIYNISAMILHSEEPGFLVHATATELHLDGSVVQNAKTLLVNANLTEVFAKLLRHPENKYTDNSCLAELSFAINMEATLVAQGPLSVEKLSLTVSQATTTISDGFYTLVQEREPSHIPPSDNKVSYDFYDRIYPIIPKNFVYKMEDVSIRGVNENSRTEFVSALQAFTISSKFVNNSDLDNYLLPQLRLSLQLLDLQVQNSRERLLLLKSWSLDARLEDNVLNLYIKLNTLTVTYNHETFNKWIRTNFLQGSKKALIARSSSIDSQPPLKETGRKEKKPSDGFLEKLMTNVMINGCAEFCNVSSLVKLNGNHSSIGFSHTKIILEQALETRDTKYASLIPRLVLSNRHWQLEILVESFWWSFKEWTQEPATSKKTHVWGTPVYLGMTLIKFGTYGNSEIKIESLLDTLQLEWSSYAAEYILLTLKCMRDYQTKETEHLHRSSKTKFQEYITINLALSHINLFFATQENEFVVTRLNSVSLDKSIDCTTAQFKGFKMLTVKSKDSGFNCIRTEDISEYISYVKMTQVEFKTNAECSEFTLHLLEEIVVYWTTNIHLKLLYLWRDCVEFWGKFLKNTKLLSQKPNKKRECIYNFRVFGMFGFHIQISPSHKAKVTIDDMTVSHTKDNLTISNKTGTISIDDAEIFTLLGLSLSRVKENQTLLEERLENENIQLRWNNPWGFSIDSFRAAFPYQHNFADAYRNEFVSVFKWLKIVHNRKKMPFTTDSPLPSDLVINVKEFIFEMADDPFEVKLRDNYELLLDEYNESLKRQKMLKERIEELCKTHLHLPAKKVEELYDSLKKKNAEIYVQRSKQMNYAVPPRTRLFAWSITNLEIMNTKRDVEVFLGEPWGSTTIERSMLPQKFYHDFYCSAESFSYAFGPCWEPVIAQCNLTFEKIQPISKDPSPPLPFWDKMRLLLHGRLTMEVQQLTILLHASLDPYNTTEEMELTWNKVVMDWLNAKFLFKGDLNIFVRTASKYDDCQLVHLPSLKLVINIQWVCLGDPNDHHNVIQCAPDKIPEYSSNQVHDSFRAFRSQNVNLSISLETKPSSTQSPTNSCPVVSLYGSTLRWIENLKLILSGVTRPTRRGRIFNNIRPRKVQLSRHYKKVHLQVGLHKFQVCYWMSFAMQKGFELLGGRLSSSSEHTLSLVPIDDGLKHRPKAEWSIVYMNSELNDTEIWLKSALQEDPEKEAISLRQPVEKCFCLSVAKVSYGRETVLPKCEPSAKERNKEAPTHKLVVYDLRGAWTKSNRNVAFALFDTFMKTKRMKKNLSTDAIKSIRKENNSTPLKRRSTDSGSAPSNSQLPSLPSTSTLEDAPSPSTKLQSGNAANMLKQLIAEADNKNVVFSDDLSSATRQQQLQGRQACQEDDVLHMNWLISLVNAQVLLRGCETKGYVILSAANAQILQKIHRPVWKDRTLVSKTTWVGLLECLQYYATVNAGQNDSINESQRTRLAPLPRYNRQTLYGTAAKARTMASFVTYMLVLWCSVGDDDALSIAVSPVTRGIVGFTSHLRDCVFFIRIVSRCKCEFFYVGYGDISVDPEEFGEVPPPPQEDVGLWDHRQTPADAFTLMHHDLDVCTNSLQYAMLLDIVNNLLLYVEPHRKEALERLARMRFQLQLHSMEDQRRPIQSLQNQVRSTISKLRRLEKETYLINKASQEEPNNVELLQEIEKLENLVYECKDVLNAQSEELDMMISCYKESQLLANSRLATTRNNKPLTVVRANEIFFKHAQWRLTEADGQIGIADLVLSNFLYTKISKSDDSVEHLLELGYLRMTNLLPNQPYKEVLVPTEIQSNMPVENKRVVRVFCREKPPVGGISVKEHFEINVVPFTIGITKKFYNTMLKFCFPEKDPENIEGERGDDIDMEARGKKYRSSGRGKRDSNFYIPIDDVEKMKERAEKNKLFIYIKIPEVPVRVSYKGTKEKNLEDIRDFSLVIPTLEYHNVTWTWLDLLLAMKSDTRRVILSQAIKQKLTIKRHTGSSDETNLPHEEDKAKILFGARHATETRNSKRSGVFKFGK
ncbi:protein KIAA0100 [Agrilus planipennis]|uniref:Protein KIAA0100 n=1 Tax=Agrilus planipennis TaxID=224129 RepID=A0A7F5R7A3_AGRPL|nr:protein KIAA0100 [Agrilus planipennis]